MRQLAWAALVVLAMPACTVESPRLPDAGTPDSGAPDVGVEIPDAGPPDCVRDPGVCTAAEFCGPSGICEVRDRTCASGRECGPGDVCWVATAITSTVSRCLPPRAACTSDADCGGGRCLSSRICGPLARVAMVVDRALVPQVACATSATCGAGRVCRAGVCAACEQSSECEGGLRCESGACVEPRRCADAGDCFDGNRCEGGRCQRSTAACIPESDNQDRERATAITDLYQPDLSICGVDEDWFLLTPPVDHGVEIILTSTASQLDLRAELTTSAQQTPTGASRLDLPGRIVLRAPAGPANLYLRVYSADRSGSYDLDVRYRPGLCGDDALGLYGAPEGLQIPSNVVYDAVACPAHEDRVRLIANAGDQLVVSASFPGIDGRPSAAMARANFVDARGDVIDPDLATATGTTASAETNPLVLTGTVALVVGASRLATSGEPYTARLTRKLVSRPAACAAAQTLDPSAGPVTVQGDLSAAIDQGRPDCTRTDPDIPPFSAPGRNDVLFTLAPATQDVLVTATVRAIGGRNPQLSIGLLADCADDATAITCDAAPFARSGASLSAALAPGQGGALMISSDGGAEDVTFELVVTYDSLVAFSNDRCTAATELLMSGSQTVLLYGGSRNGVPWGARDDDRLWSDLVSNACSIQAGAGSGVDRFYSLALAPGEKAAVEMTGPRGAMMWTGRACDDMPGTCSQAQLRDDAHPVVRATFTASTAPETHYVVVDGAGADNVGSYDLRTVRNAECLLDNDCQGAGFNRCASSPCRCDDYACATAPANDRCPGTLLSLGPTGFGALQIDGSTGAAGDDYQICVGFQQKDVVYAVQVPANAAEFVARIVRATFDPAMEVRQDTCVDGGSSVRCNDDVRYPDVLLPEIRIPDPEAGTYYIIVDAFADEGAFTLEVEVLSN